MATHARWLRNFRSSLIHVHDFGGNSLLLYRWLYYRREGLLVCDRVPDWGGVGWSVCLGSSVQEEETEKFWSQREDQICQGRYVLVSRPVP